MRLSMRGFSLVELIVVIGLILLLTGGIVGGYNSFNETQKLKQAAATLKDHLRLAQAKAMAVEKPSSGCTTLVGYRVSFPSSNQYALRARCTEGGAGGSISVTLPTRVTFSPVPTNFTFQVLTRRILETTSVTIYLTNGSKTYQLIVQGSGDIDDRGIQ